ncbi:MAG: GNAT family N-acetyltransferase [Chitinophagaceae bacterium]
MLFETDRLFVRQFTEADLDDLYALSSDPVVMQYNGALLSRDACKTLLQELIDGYQQHPHFGRFAVVEKATQQYVGNYLLRPSSFMGGTETGYAFLQHAWGRGYATEITIAGLQFAHDKLQVDMLYAITDKGNSASQKVLLKCGFMQQADFMDNGNERCLFQIKR